MADQLRHAAAGRVVYEVHELLGGERELDLGVRYQSTDYGAAVEYAFEFLQLRDPRREGEVNALEVVKVANGKRETVWRYSHADQPCTRVDLVGRWGFDVTRRWHAPAWTPPRPRLTPRH